MSSIRIILADDHTLVRAGIRMLLEDAEDLSVIAEAANGDSALALVDTHRPDLLVADIAMPGLSGLDLAALVTERYSETRIILLSMHQDEEYVRRAIMAGARGYLLKDSDISELKLAVRAVARGDSYLSPAISSHLMHEYQKRSGGPAGELTPRQREVLRLIAQGKTTKAIARELRVSPKTVETHRAQIMERLQIHDVPGLVRYAIRVGLIDTNQ